MRLLFNDALHPAGIFGFIALRTCGLYGRTTACIERFFLKGSQIGIETHFTAERIQFKNKMTFGKSADRWIAGHARNGVAKARNEERIDAHAGGDECSFGTGVTAPDDDDVIVVFHGAYYTTRTFTVDIESNLAL